MYLWLKNVTTASFDIFVNNCVTKITKKINKSFDDKRVFLKIEIAVEIENSNSNGHFLSGESQLSSTFGLWTFMSL